MTLTLVAIPFCWWWCGAGGILDLEFNSISAATQTTQRCAMRLGPHSVTGIHPQIDTYSLKKRVACQRTGAHAFVDCQRASCRRRRRRQTDRSAKEWNRRRNWQKWMLRYSLLWSRERITIMRQFRYNSLSLSSFVEARCLLRIMIR